MIDHPLSLKTTGPSRTGIAPANLLDVLDVNGNIYFFSDRATNAPPVITGNATSAGPVPLTPVNAPAPGEYVAWAYPSVVDVDGDGASFVPGSGTIEISVFGPGSSPSSLAFHGFNMTELPAGAVINRAVAQAFVSFHSSIPMLAFIVGFSQPALTYEDLLTSDLGWGGDGTLTTASFTFTLEYSLPPPLGVATWAMLGIQGLAIAVYYTIPSSDGGFGSPPPGGGTFKGAPYLPWLLQVPNFSFYRSLQTGTGSFVIQNVSGDTLSRDAEKLLRASAFEGAFFVYRLWQPDAEAAWIEVHGTLTVDDVGVDTLTFKAMALLNPAQDDTPLEIYCETCQLQWAGPRCGSTQPTECSYSFQTCQVVERIMVVTNDYEKNYGEATANTALNVINRRRKI